MREIIYIYALLILSSFCSCYYDCDENKLPRNTYMLPNDAKEALAYKGNDTLRFIKNNTDTIIYFGSKIDTLFEERPRILECDGEIGIYEKYEVVFTSKETTQLKINLYYPAYSITGISIEYSATFFDFFLATKKSNNTPDIDSLNINGKYYYDIFILYNYDGSLYYNKENGIIKIITNTEKLEIL